MSARATEQLTVLDADGVEVVLPSVFVVCPRCEGRGDHDHPAFSNGITSEEWNGPDWDDDDRGAYLAGRYNVPCSECHGKRVVLEADEARLTPAQRDLLAEHQAEMADLRACERSERFMHGEG